MNSILSQVIAKSQNSILKNFFMLFRQDFKLNPDWFRSSANQHQFEMPSQILDSFQVLKSNLLDTASLMKNYEKICQRFKFNQSHLFLRPIAPSIGKPSGSDVSKIKGRSVPPDDRTVDRFKPSHYSVAINDYDEDVLKNVKPGILICSLIGYLEQSAKCAIQRQ